MIKIKNKINIVTIVLIIALVSLLTRKQTIFADNATDCTNLNTEYNYVLIEYNNCIAVYKACDLINPNYVINLDVSSLPLKDQGELKKGILILDKEELDKVIEDYTG